MKDDLVHGELSDVGSVRSENQDRCGVSEEVDGAEGARRGRLFVVCDGMGGHNGGSIASATAVEALLEAWRKAEGGGVRRRLANSIETANAEVRRKAAQDVTLRNMGTTLVAVALAGSRAQVAHVGDSRCYLLRDGKAELLTRDHTYLNELVDVGLLTPEQARQHPDRNIITRCIGVGDGLQVDFRTVPLREGDRFLLCTDGLYNYVDADELVREAARHEPGEAAKRLVDLANRRGGEDNITCLIVRVNRVPQAPESPEDDDTSPAAAQPAPTTLTPDPFAVTPTTATAALGARPEAPSPRKGPDVGRELTEMRERTAPAPAPRRRAASHYLLWLLILAAAGWVGWLILQVL
ncbi:MAG TPA: Stp1/IreP family PP2C-type Ser/Thr phosphatase [Planctomycetota bacterium]|nr:Stp1/IreP family PP2C-type Ser/Thr phosphatase [Planctomycetota bacterium]